MHDSDEPLETSCSFWPHGWLVYNPSLSASFQGTVLHAGTVRGVTVLQPQETGCLISSAAGQIPTSIHLPVDVDKVEWWALGRLATSHSHHEVSSVVPEQPMFEHAPTPSMLKLLRWARSVRTQCV